MIHIKYRNKWEKQERLMSFTGYKNYNRWVEDNDHRIRVLDYCTTDGENPFNIWRKSPFIDNYQITNEITYTTATNTGTSWYNYG